MNIDKNVDLDVFISLFDIVILLLLIWGGYKGYVKGAIVEAISLFALLGGLVFSVVFTKLLYNFFVTRSNQPDLFASILLGSIFVGALWFSNFITHKTKENAGALPKGRSNRFIGMGLGISKFFLIAAVYVVVLYKVNIYANFLPPGEQKSKLANASKFILTKIFPNLKMENFHGVQDTIQYENTSIYETDKDNNF